MAEVAPVNPNWIMGAYLVSRHRQDTSYIIVITLGWSLHRIAGTSGTYRLCRGYPPI